MVDPPCKFVLTLKVAKPLNPAHPGPCTCLVQSTVGVQWLRHQPQKQAVGIPKLHPSWASASTESLMPVRRHLLSHTTNLLLHAATLLWNPGHSAEQVRQEVISLCPQATQMRTKQPISEGNGPSHELDKSRTVMKGRQVW